MTESSQREDDDSPGKRLHGHYFQGFLEWFFPAAAADVDWGRGFEFLDRELQKGTRRAANGRRYADKRVKLWRLSGVETGVLVQVLAARFGRFPEWVSAMLAAADPARVAGWARRVLAAESLEAVFAEVA